MPTPHRPHRPWRRAAVTAAVAGVAGLAAAIPATGLASSPPTDPPSGPPTTGAAGGDDSAAPDDPTAAGAPSGTISAADITDSTVADAKAGLEQWLADHPADPGPTAATSDTPDMAAGSDAVPAPGGDVAAGTQTCPTMPDANLHYFVIQAGAEPGPAPTEVHVASAADASPDLAAAEPAAEAAAVSCTPDIADPAASTMSAPSTDIPADPATVPPGSFSLEGDTAPAFPEIVLVATSMDDSEFAAAVTAAVPDAVVESPDGDLDGELVGHCDATTDRCQAWWHQDGLVIGLELNGLDADVTGSLAQLTTMVPTALVSLVAAGEGTEPSIPDPPATEPEPAFERIVIPEGETTTSVDGTVDRGAFVPYAFAAGAGQQVEVALTSPDANATFDMFTPGGELIANDETSFSGVVPEHGDYLVQVGATTDTADFTIDLAITGEPTPEPPPDGGAIQIPPGESSTSVDGTVDRGQFDTWTVRAAADQQLDLNVTSPEGNATFDLFTPGGELIANDQTSFSGVVPEDGDYALEVGATADTADYTIDVTIT